MRVEVIIVSMIDDFGVLFQFGGDAVVSSTVLDMFFMVSMLVVLVLVVGAVWWML
jgi:hypothetical protein